MIDKLLPTLTPPTTEVDAVGNVYGLRAYKIPLIIDKLAPTLIPAIKVEYVTVRYLIITIPEPPAAPYDLPS